MSESGAAKTFLQRIRPWLIAWGLVQLAVRVGGLVLSRRLDTGEETSSRQRRVKTMGQLRLCPTSQELSRLDLDLALAGLDLDLTQARPAPEGVDITVNCFLAGGSIRVPTGWHVTWERHGAGGVDDKGADKAAGPRDPAAADVRIHLNAVFGGLNVERADTTVPGA